MGKTKAATLVLFLAGTIALLAQEITIPLWPQDKIPNRIPGNEQELREYTNMLRISKVQEPEIEVFLPAKANASGEAILIFPGGGYSLLAYDWEGSDIAKYLNSKGIAGIVVKYRLPSKTTQKNKHYVPLIDAQRAIRITRGMADEFHINPQKVGVIGFSAGGHLAASLATHHRDSLYLSQDRFDTLSARPDFMALAYPVITFGEPSAHSGSQRQLLGERPDKKLLQYFSLEKQVAMDTPPTFLVHASDDKGVPVENSLLFYAALKDKDVPAQMHIYPQGGHGFSLALDKPYLRMWTDLLYNWIVSLK